MRFRFFAIGAEASGYSSRLSSRLTQSRTGFQLAPVWASVPIGYLGEHMQFDTTRSARGELVYQLKYRNGPLTDIVDTAGLRK